MTNTKDERYGMIDGDAIFCKLLVEQYGNKMAAESLGVAHSTMSYIVNHNRTGKGTGEGGVKLIYELAAECILSREPFAQARAEKHNLEKRIADLEGIVQARDAEIEQLKAQGSVSFSRNGITLTRIRAVIRSYYSANVFDLTQEDLDLLGKTLREVAKGG